MEQAKGLFCLFYSGVTGCQSQHQCHLMANSFNVLIMLHGQVSLAAVNQICVIYEAMNGCKKS